jgi:hypothetical protein
MLSDEMRPEGIAGLARGFELMLGTWPTRVSDLMSSSFSGWLVPVLKLLRRHHWPIVMRNVV